MFGAIPLTPLRVSVCKALMRYVRKRRGSPSPSSSDSHATGRPHPAPHSLIKVVLPKPAGEAMRVSLQCSPSFSRAIKRGRWTACGRGGGTYSLVRRIGVDTFAVTVARGHSLASLALSRVSATMLQNSCLKLPDSGTG